jgi:hypothetical protein
LDNVFAALVITVIIENSKGKGKRHEGISGKGGIAALFLTVGIGRSALRPGRFTSGHTALQAPVK